MNHHIDTTSSHLSDEEVTLVGKTREDGLEMPDVERLTGDAECEIAALTEAAGIDSSSLTDQQIMDALYQMG